MASLAELQRELVGAKIEKEYLLPDGVQTQLFPGEISELWKAKGGATKARLLFEDGDVLDVSVDEARKLIIKPAPGAAGGKRQAAAAAAAGGGRQAAAGASKRARAPPPGDDSDGEPEASDGDGKPKKSKGGEQKRSEPKAAAASGKKPAKSASLARRNWQGHAHRAPQAPSSPALPQATWPSLPAPTWTRLLWRVARPVFPP
jgi:hypothetical protein